MKTINEEKGISREVVDATELIFKELINDIKLIQPKIIGNDVLYSNILPLTIFNSSINIEYKVFVTNDVEHFDYYQSQCKGDNIYIYNSKTNTIVILRVILVNDDIDDNINIIRYKPFSKEILSHELKHMFQSIKRGNKPLLNYKNGLIYSIAKNEYFKNRGALKKSFKWYISKIAFAVYSLTPIEITANQQKDWTYICNNLSNKDEAISFLSSKNCEMNLYLKKSEQMLNLINNNINNKDLINYLYSTYKRNIDWFIKFFEEGKWRCTVALMRLEKLINNKFDNQTINEEIYITGVNKPSFVTKNRLKNESFYN